jgi:NhaA family Na+:H+ antiporter
VAAREALSPIERLEIVLHPWVAFLIMPLFALANSGIPIVPGKFDAALALAIFVGFVIGKPTGILLFSVLAVQLRVALRPDELPWSILAAGGMLVAIFRPHHNLQRQARQQIPQKMLCSRSGIPSTFGD